VKYKANKKGVLKGEQCVKALFWSFEVGRQNFFEGSNFKANLAKPGVLAGLLGTTPFNQK
jgi:hypothetical protein